jgi:fumarate reductase flavoprotein subunit
LTAARGGAQVIVFEKLPMPGGYSLMAEGMFAAESVIQEKEYIGITKEEAFRNHMNSTHWCANGRLVRTFIDKSASTIDWVMQLGVNFSKVLTLWPGGPRTWHMMESGGKGFIETLAKAIAENGVKVFYATPAKKLLMDKNNKVSGIIAQDANGNDIQVDTPVVIIAGGGYANNKEWIDKYTDLQFEPISIVPMQQTGDHIQMAWDAGAAADGMGVMMAIPAVPGERPTSHLWASAIQPLLWINKQGERFCDESLGFYFPIAANALAKQKDGTMYTIFDENSRRILIEHGTEVSLGVYVPVTTKLDRLDAEIEKGVAEGKAFVENSLDTLAKKIDVNPKILHKTVHENNRAFEMNEDNIFAKNHKYLQPVKKEPYYAVKCTFHIFTTLGGIKINHDTEVLNKELAVIPGLYAIGNCAGGMYGWDYDVFTTGGALGFAVNAGRIAAERALAYIK